MFNIILVLDDGNFVANVISEGFLKMKTVNGLGSETFCQEKSFDVETINV